MTRRPIKAIFTSRKLIGALLLLLFLSWPLEAAPVRISFLTQEKALQDTLGLLQKSGCVGDASADFGKAVKAYNQGGLRFDVSHFPPDESGFYSFQSVSQLLNVLPSQLWKSPHVFGLNCFDTVILVSNGKFRTNLHPDDHFDEFLPAGIMANGDLGYAHAQTARESFNLSMRAWYQTTTSNYIPQSLANTRVVLMAEMYCFHLLAASTTPQNVEANVFGTLRESWRKQKIVFPSDFQIVLFHQVSLTRHFIATTHAALLFPEHNGFCFLEKEGGQGPFVRLDFQNRGDLLAWLAGTLGECGGEYLFVTFNANEIQLLATK